MNDFFDDERIISVVRDKDGISFREYAHTDFIGSMKRRGESNVSYDHQQWKETVIFFGGVCFRLRLGGKS